MPSISKINVNGTLYDIQDAGASRATGSTFSGNIAILNSDPLFTIRSSDVDFSKTYAQNTNHAIDGIYIRDVSNTCVGRAAVTQQADNSMRYHLYAYRSYGTNNSSHTYNGIRFDISPSGVPSITFDQPNALVNGLADSNIVLPVSIGGTGGTDSGLQTITNQTVFQGQSEGEGVGGGTIYYRKIGKWVYICSYGVKISASSLTHNDGILLGVLPSGFRPNVTAHAIYTIPTVSNSTGTVRISTGGEIKFYKPYDIATWPSGYSINFSLMYMTA